MIVTATPFKEKSSDHYKDLHKLKLLTNFNVNLTSFLGVTNYVLNVKFISPPGDDVILTPHLSGTSVYKDFYSLWFLTVLAAKTSRNALDNF